MSLDHQIISLRKRRWLDFYDLTKTASNLFIINYTPGLYTRPWPRPELIKERIEWSWLKYQIQMEQLAWLDDDSIPFLDIFTGTEIFAHAFGCKVVYPIDDMPFALPLINTAQEVSSLKVPDFGSTDLSLLFEIADILIKRSGPDALLRLVDVQSPMDIAALIWEKSSFYTALHDAPEAILELADKVEQLLTHFLDEWFRRYGSEFIAHYPDYYMPQGITVSEDEVGSVSTSMFEDFFLKELNQLSLRYGGIGMHCCANAHHQWDNFLKIQNLHMLNFVQPPEIVRKAWSFFAGHTPQTHDYNGDGPAWTWPDQYPSNARILMNVTVDDKTQAVEVSQKIREKKVRILQAN
jgi:hypothetical protein